MFQVTHRSAVARGVLHELKVPQRHVRILVTWHAIARMKQWRIREKDVFRTLFGPHEVLRGHGERFIAHRSRGRHVIRVVYEYDQSLPVVVTVYVPYKERYFQGGGSFADQILP